MEAPDELKGRMTKPEDKSNKTVQDLQIQRNEIGWISCQIAASLFTIISVYLTFSSIIYKYRVWKKRRLQNGNHALSDQHIRTVSGDMSLFSNKSRRREIRIPNACSITQRSKVTAWSASALDMLIIAAAVLTTLRMVSEQQVLNFSDRSKYLCNVISDIHVILYALPIAPIYIFLWLRQRILYSDPPLSLFYPTKVRAVSITIIAVMVVSVLLTTLVFTLAMSYQPGRFGCEIEIEQSSLPIWAPWLLIIFFTGIFQVLLLSLYIGPMICQRLKRNNPEGGLELRRHGKDFITKSIKRVCAITCACVASDILAAFITGAIRVPIVSNLIYDLNLIVNLVGIVCSFTNWKARIFPLCNCGINQRSHCRNTQAQTMSRVLHEHHNKDDARTK